MRGSTLIAEQTTFFNDIDVAAPETEGVKYAGSKLKLLPHILKLAAKVQPKTILDGFAGTTRVSQVFAQRGYQVVSSDIATWSKTFGDCYLLSKKERSEYQELVNHLNSLPGIAGWFTEHYGGEDIEGSAIQSDGLKKPWQRRNTMRLDAIREEIDNLGLATVDRAVALTSLIRAMDAVDSTLGHYVSYLKDWSARSYKEIELKVPATHVYEREHTVIQGDIFDSLPSINVDLAYFDPPYGSNNEKMPPSRVRYASYYHLWTTICLNDQPELFGKAKRRADTSDRIAASVFEEFRKNEDGQFIVVEAIAKILKAVRSEWVILSYSSGGRATAEELNDAISESGKLVDVVEIDYKKNVMAGMKWTDEWIKDAELPNREFLFLIQK